MEEENKMDTYPQTEKPQTNLQKPDANRQQGQPYPNGQPNMQGQPYPNGQPNMQGQPYPNRQLNMQGQPYPNGQPNMQGQPYPNGQPNMQGQPYPNGQPNMQGQPYPNGQPNMQGQPYPNGQPNMQGQPYPNGQQGGYYHQSVEPNRALLYLKDIWKTFLQVVKKPAKEGKAFVKEGETSFAIGFCLIQAVLVSVFALIADGRSGIYKMLDAFGLVKVFFVTLLLSIVLSAIYAGLLTGCSAILHLEIDFKKALRAVGSRSVGVIPVIVLAIILAILNPVAGVVVFAASVINGSMYLIAALAKQENIDKMLIAVGISAMLVFVITIAVIGNYIGVAIGNFVSDSIGGYLDTFSELKDLIE